MTEPHEITLEQLQQMCANQAVVNLSVELMGLSRFFLTRVEGIPDHHPEVGTRLAGHEWLLTGAYMFRFMAPEDVLAFMHEGLSRIDLTKWPENARSTIGALKEELKARLAAIGEHQQKH